MRSPSPLNLEPQARQPQAVVTTPPPQMNNSYADVAMVGFTPDDSGLEVAIDSRTRSILLVSHLRSIPWLQVSRCLKGYLSSVENISIFNSAEDTGIPVCLVPLNLEAYSGCEDGLPMKGLLDTITNTAMVQNFDVFRYMSTTIYLLSNRLVDMEGEALVSLLETLRYRIHLSLLLAMFKTPLPALRAAWEVLIRFEETARFGTLFDLLVDVGIQNEWLNVERMGHDYLYYAVRAKCFDAVGKLLIHGCRADSGWLHEKNSAILKAIQGGHLTTAKLLMQYCDVNRDFIFYRDPASLGQSNKFAMFMYQYQKDDPNHQRGLQLFFKHGAQSDAPWFDSPFEPRRNPAMLDVYKLNNISLKWWPTILDYYFYADRSTYHQLLSYGKREQRASSAIPNWRSDILLSLEQKFNSRVICRLRKIERELKEHRLKNPVGSQGFPRPLLTVDRLHEWERHPLLELLFIEQFLFEGVWYQGKVRTNLNWDLIELDVDPSIPSLPNTDMTALLSVALALIPTTGGWTSGMNRIFHRCCTFHRDSINWSEAFRAVAEMKDIEVFKLFALRAPNPGQNGATALLEAARTENYAVIQWLLAIGVDIQSLAATKDHSTAENGGISPIQSRNFKPQSKAALSPRMIDFLSTFGLHVQSKVKTYDPLLELKTVLIKGPTDLLPRVKYLLHKIRGLSNHEPEPLSSYLLELCLRGPNPWKERHQRLEVYEFCYQQVAELTPGSPLSVLIYAGGRTELIHELLDKSAEVNAYSHDMDAEFPKLSEPWSLTPLQAAASCGNEVIVNMLLERGAEVNAPALGRLGKTALQNVCAWIPSTSDERARKTRIINLLIERGADVNAAPADWCGRTALQIAAKAGELELVALLLHFGADVNAPPCASQGWVALDCSSFEGRLDVVKLLLDSGARSLVGGLTGYDGAIDLAKHRGHFATADLIKTHAREVAH